MKNLTIISLVLITLIFSCKVEELKTPPVVKTNSSSEIAATSAKIWGEVVEEGSSVAIERGFVYSEKNPSPSTSDAKVVSGYGKGEFNTLLSNLTPNTKYYYKAYASNQTGITYGDAKNFTTLEDIKLPTVSTNVISNITNNSCTTGGNISSDGGSAITEKGIVFSTTPNPTISNNKITSAGSNNYSIELTGLAENTTYYIRAFATNSKGTNYGDQQVLTTLKSINSILKNGLFAYYPFNANANDESGNGNSGVINNAILTSNRFEKSNSAFEFDGRSTRIVTSKIPTFGQSLTISAWFIPYSLQAWGTIIDCRTSTNAGLGIEINGKLSFTTSIGGSYSLMFNNSSLIINKWTHVVVVYNGSQKLIYINGKLDATESYTKALLPTSEPYVIGDRGVIPSGLGNYFNGKIDDIGIWNRVLSNEEIKFLYENEFKP